MMIYVIEILDLYHKKKSKIPYRNISHADDCELSCVDDVTWEHTYFFLKLWVDYDFATACSTTMMMMML